MNIKSEMEENKQRKIFIQRIVIFIYCLILIIPITILIELFKLEPNFYNSEEKYNSIAELNQEDLLNINNFKNNKINLTIIKHLSLLFAKFARYPYTKENYFFSKKFMNFEIINYGNKSEDNYFFTFKNDTLKTVIISFPGTLEPPQLLDEAFGSVLENFDEENNKILIGKYFGERTKTLLELIFNEDLEKLIKNDYQIISTGHSLGGAMAQCFMYFALTKGKITKKNNLPITITYGQPKVGNIYFAHFLDNNSFLNIRFVNKNDLVHFIPFCSGVFNHFKYLFDYLDDVNIYAHTTIQINQHNICNLPTILYYFSMFIKTITFIIKLMLAFTPLYIFYKFLFYIYSIWNNIKDENYKCFYILLFLFFFSPCLYNLSDISIFYKYSYSTSFIWIALVIILSIIIAFIAVIIIVQIFYFFKYIMFCFQKTKDKQLESISKYFNLQSIFEIVYLIFSSFWGSTLYFISILSHTTYQNTNLDEETENNNPITKDGAQIIFNHNYNLWENEDYRDYRNSNLKKKLKRIKKDEFEKKYY